MAAWAFLICSGVIFSSAWTSRLRASWGWSGEYVPRARRRVTRLKWGGRPGPGALLLEGDLLEPGRLLGLQTGDQPLGLRGQGLHLLLPLLRDGVAPAPGQGRPLRAQAGHRLHLLLGQLQLGLHVADHEQSKVV